MSSTFDIRLILGTICPVGEVHCQPTAVGTTCHTEEVPFCGAIITLKDFNAVCLVGAVESVTFAVKLKEPDAVDVPEMIPLFAPRTNPVGSAPAEIDQA